MHHKRQSEKCVVVEDGEKKAPHMSAAYLRCLGYSTYLPFIVGNYLSRCFRNSGNWFLQPGMQLWFQAHQQHGILGVLCEDITIIDCGPGATDAHKIKEHHWMLVGRQLAQGFNRPHAPSLQFGHVEKAIRPILP